MSAVRGVPPDRLAAAFDDALSEAPHRHVRLWVREGPNDALGQRFHDAGRPWWCDVLGNKTGERLADEPIPEDLVDVHPLVIAGLQVELDRTHAKLGSLTRKRRQRWRVIGVRSNGESVVRYDPTDDDEELREAFDGAPAGYLLINAAGTCPSGLLERGQTEAKVVRADGATGRVPVRMEDVVVLAEDFERRRYGTEADAPGPALPDRAAPSDATADGDRVERARQRDPLVPKERRALEKARKTLATDRDAWHVEGTNAGRPKLYQLENATGLDKSCFRRGRRIGDALEPELDALWSAAHETPRPR